MSEQNKRENHNNSDLTANRTAQMPRKRYRSISEDIRKCICILAESGRGGKEIGELLGLPHTTVQSIIKHYFETGEVHARSKGGDKKI